ncbi:hypothetical protein B7Z17_02475 [Candidatus Saccharibacteria bacterium 32-49-10]|nr:MAG: hypothetical protein B7Z17_02475 [Candidatus Saccharibacteria bacterium 32-49-10]
MTSRTDNQNQPKRHRIIALDLLRGFFIMAVIVDHVPWAPSLFFAFSGGGRLFASPAEGFFVISGLLVGYLYGPRILSQTKSVVEKIWRRAGLLYVLSVVFTLIFTAWAVSLTEGRPSLELWNGTVSSYFLNTLTLRYSYGWTDFLSRYAVFMAFAPLLVWLVAKGKWWLVAGGSVAIWSLLGRWEMLMPFAAWQILFSFGIIIGYYLPVIENWWRQSLSQSTRRIAAMLIISSALVSFIVSVVLFIILPQTGSEPVTFLGINIDSIRPLFYKNVLGIGRLLLGVLWFSALYLIFRRYEQSLQRLTRGVVEVFGQNSLFVYGLHSFVLFAIITIVYPIDRSSVIWNTIYTSLVLVFIYLVTKYRHRLASFIRPSK